MLSFGKNGLILTATKILDDVSLVITVLVFYGSLGGSSFYDINKLI